jgi:CDP-diacylglycerol---glycerol-3-phosphate 3-phosphatidyltransferase
MAAWTGASRRYDSPMGKSDRALTFGTAAPWIGIGARFAPWVSIVFPQALSLLLILTSRIPTQEGGGGS